MNVLAAVCIAPCGIGDEFAPYVAPVIQIIRESGLKNRTNSMFTEIEGEWDDVMAVVKKATFYLAEQGLRLKADIRPGHTEMMEHKTAIVEQLLQETK